ncbi:MAG: acyltransferase family protein [Bacteroidota bacterium]
MNKKSFVKSSKNVEKIPAIVKYFTAFPCEYNQFLLYLLHCRRCLPNSTLDTAETIIQNTLYGLDHLRAFAISFVFLFHYQIQSGGEPSWIAPFAQFGWTGVDLFFVLSGFLISSQLFQQIQQGRTVSFKTFFLKRFFRIIPAYLVVVGIYFAVPLFREKEALPALWKFLTFTQNFGLDLKTTGTFSHAWSLCVEEQFYLALPLILIALQRSHLFKRSYWLLAGLFIFGFAVRLYSFENVYLPAAENGNAWIEWYKYIYYPTYNRLDGLLAGISIAALSQFLPNVWNSVSRFGNIYLLIGVFILTGAYYFCEDMSSFSASVFGFPLIALGYGCIVLGAVSPGSILYRWKSRTTSLIAALSYALYLTHKGIIHLTMMLVADLELDEYLVMFLCALSCLLGAFILHAAVERPFMKLRRRIVEQE